MEDNDANRIAHLSMIQEVIKRQASNSFLVKGWSLTLASALVALAIANKSTDIAYLVLIPVVIFWILDVYWLRQERLYRSLYNKVRTAGSGSLEGNMFSMETTPVGVPSLLRTTFNPTIILLHGSLIVAALLIILSGNISISL